MNKPLAFPQPTSTFPNSFRTVPIQHFIFPTVFNTTRRTGSIQTSKPQFPFKTFHSSTSIHFQHPKFHQQKPSHFPTFQPFSTFFQTHSHHQIQFQQFQFNSQCQQSIQLFQLYRRILFQHFSKPFTGSLGRINQQTLSISHTQFHHTSTDDFTRFTFKFKKHVQQIQIHHKLPVHHTTIHTKTQSFTSTHTHPQSFHSPTHHHFTFTSQHSTPSNFPFNHTSLFFFSFIQHVIQRNFTLRISITYNSIFTSLPVFTHSNLFKKNPHQFQQRQTQVFQSNLSFISFQH